MRKPGMAKYAAQIGPWKTDPDYRGWWERKKAEYEQMLVDAKASGDTRLKRLATERIKEAVTALSTTA